jgi:hypothetical protein
MGNPGKFGALAGLKGTPAAAAIHAIHTNTTGRPRGKRSNPDYNQYTVLLKRKTHREATNIIRDRDDGTDFADLCQSLLEEWLAKQGK